MKHVPPSVRAALKNRGQEAILNQEGEYLDYKSQIDQIIHGNDLPDYEDSDLEMQESMSPEEKRANKKIEEYGDKYKSPKDSFQEQMRKQIENETDSDVRSQLEYEASDEYGKERKDIKTLKDAEDVLKDYYNNKDFQETFGYDFDNFDIEQGADGTVDVVMYDEDDNEIGRDSYHIKNGELIGEDDDQDFRDSLNEKGYYLNSWKSDQIKRKEEFDNNFEDDLDNNRFSDLDDARPHETKLNDLNLSDSKVWNMAYNYIGKDKLDKLAEKLDLESSQDIPTSELIKYMSDDDIADMMRINGLDEDDDYEEDLEENENLSPMEKSLFSYKPKPLTDEQRELVKDHFRKENDNKNGSIDTVKDYLKPFSTDINEDNLKQVISNADDDTLDMLFGKDTPERKLAGAIKAGNNTKHWYEGLDDSDEHARLYKEDAMKVNPERAALIAAALNEYSDEADRGVITYDQMKRYGEKLGLPQMSDRDLRLMWDDVHNIGGYLGYGQKDFDRSTKLLDAQSAFTEVVNQEARNRKAKGNYFPYNDEDIEKAKNDIYDIASKIDGYDLDDYRAYLTSEDIDKIERIANEYHLTTDDVAKISPHLNPNGMGYRIKGWKEPEKSKKEPDIWEEAEKYPVKIREALNNGILTWDELQKMKKEEVDILTDFLERFNVTPKKRRD